MNVSPDVLKGKESESSLQSAIIDYAHLCHWVLAHFRPARVTRNGQESWRTAVSADGAGFPDLCLVRPPRVVFIEVKSAKGKLSPEQEMWKRLLEQCPGVEYYCMRPDDWLMIEVLLARRV